MKKIFVHKIDIFNMDLLVVVGYKADKIKDWLKKKGTKGADKMFDKEVQSSFDEVIYKNSGLVFQVENNESVLYILWLKDFEWNNLWLDTLNHEINHLRQYVFENKTIRGEDEFEAYFHESVYRGLRQKLQRYIKI